MTLPRRLLLYVVLGLGLVGFIACAAAIVGLWFIGARLRHTTEAVFTKVDGSLVAIQERTQQTRQRIEDSAISTESIASILKEWTLQETGERLALKVDLAEKSEKLLFVIEQADVLLELSSSSIESAQLALSGLNAIELPIDSQMIDAVNEQIASLRSQLAEAMNFVKKLRDVVAAIGAEDPPKERIERAVQFSLSLIATLGSIDSRIDKFQTRLLETQKNLHSLKSRSIWWIRLVTITAAVLIVWIAAGQLALSYLIWVILRSARRATEEDRPQRSTSSL